ncbi:MAG: cupin domain-containing protein [Thermoplasmatota archaeon]
MIRKTAHEVPATEVIMEGVKNTYIQWLYSKEDGAPNFSMRRFILKAGGKIPLHDHPWEHEIYILSGSARVFTDIEETIVKEGDVLFVPVDEPHGYENTGGGDLIFLCMIPNNGDTR